ncbi:AmmeMemoRadiSam system radical SAM enzyme [Candidatus Woesearchaeota archaeon]|nr:AmmeMemoRadiSam system radical SAM enzyme [Candidatus Woesearchaeota archaeon]
MKEALYYEVLERKKTRCRICPRNCIIENGKRGFCRARENQDGKLYSLVYAAPCSVNIDPIEKKPLYHFLPRTKTFSIGTAGCNLRCKFCQNWKISQAMPEDLPLIELSTNKAVETAKAEGCKSISYTYTEPSIFYEYVLDTAKLAKKKGLKNVMVSNGFINHEPLKKWCKYMDAASIDLKSFSDDFYRKYTGAWIKPVLETLKILKKEKVWIEITNLIIPGLNDDMEEIKEMCRWIKKELGEEVPLHFSRFFPDYIMKDIGPTRKETLFKAKEVAEKAGLKNIHLGNI